MNCEYPCLTPSLPGLPCPLSLSTSTMLPSWFDCLPDLQQMADLHLQTVIRVGNNSADWLSHHSLNPGVSIPPPVDHGEGPLPASLPGITILFSLEASFCAMVDLSCHSCCLDSSFVLTFGHSCLFPLKPMQWQTGQLRLRCRFVFVFVFWLVNCNQAMADGQ